MKLNEINFGVQGKRLNKVMESRFGFSIDYNKLTVSKAKRLQQAIGESLNRIRHSVNLHSAERNPKYLELLMVHEGLTNWLDARLLTEGELGKSEAILAAKDIVDTIQDMLEKVSKIQSEQLPALLDAVRDQIGSQQADAFKGQMSAMLPTLLDQLSQARETADAAARGLAGEAVETPMEVPGAEEPAAEVPAVDTSSELDQEESFAAADAAAGGAEEMGRERR